TPDDNPGNDDDSSDDIDVVPPGTEEADLSITKQGPSAVFVNTNFDYTITVFNSGPNIADDVIVTDVLPAALQFVSDTDSCIEQPLGTLSCLLGDIGIGNNKSFNITVRANSTGTITNQGSVSSDTDDQDESNNISNIVETDVLEEGSDLADLSVTKDADLEEVEPGEELEYTITVTNDGPSSAVNVTVSDKLPPQVEFVSSIPPISTQIGNELTWEFETIENNASEIITLVVKVKENVPEGTTISNIASVISDTEDPDDDNNESPEEETDVGKGEDEDKNDGGMNHWDTRPTFGINHETRNTLKVENGFTFNGDSFTVTDNHHTPFAQKSINIGTENTFTAKVYASKRLMVQEFIFGIPEVGKGHLAEMRVEVWFDRDGKIEEVKIDQNTNVIEPESLRVFSERVKCIEHDLEEECYSTQIIAIFLEPLMYSTMGIKAIDWELRDHTTYLNDGFDISGASLNPMLTSLIPSNLKSQGLILVTQTEKYSPYWIAEDGRMFERNNFGSFKEINQSFQRFQDSGEPRNRLHSGFNQILEEESKKALQIFDSTKIISDLPDSFGYHTVYSERINPEMIEKMVQEEQRAKDYLLKKYLQARW
ncbi:MAG: DUF11 domain-containing protein, partial [Nitrosopumilaceae archaeon]|nr:DUF11 domain-containing protein [Nitrosopumilaceae archaeon]